MRWRWFLRRRVERNPLPSLSRSAAARLAQEVEAFLSGSAGEWFLVRCREVPAWAYVNRVAHAEPRLLSELAAHAHEGQPDPLGWRTAVALPVKETLRVGHGDPRAIRHIQLDRLMSLESQLMSGTDRGVSPTQVVALGRALLHNH